MQIFHNPFALQIKCNAPISDKNTTYLKSCWLWLSANCNLTSSERRFCSSCSASSLDIASASCNCSSSSPAVWGLATSKSLGNSAPETSNQTTDRVSYFQVNLNLCWCSSPLWTQDTSDWTAYPTLRRCQKRSRSERTFLWPSEPSRVRSSIFRRPSAN